MIIFFNKLYRKLIFNLIFLRKSITINFRKNKNYFEKHEFDLNQSLNIESIDDINLFHKKLSKLIYSFLIKNNFDIKDLSNFISGKIITNKNGIKPDEFQKLLIDLSITSNGLFQKLLHGFLFQNFNYDHSNIILKSPFLDNIGLIEINDIVKSIRNDGYYVLSEKLDSEFIDKIINWSKKLKYNTINYDDTRSQNQTIDFLNPNCVQASVSSEDLRKNENIKSLINDPILLKIASSYFEVNEPYISESNLWWSFKNKERISSSEAAQEFHFDLDSIKWLKIFIYFTDVNENNGPHTYIPGSHIEGMKNNKLLYRGYNRISEKEMTVHQQVKPKTIIGKKGTIIIGDTNCFHKGNPILSGARLMFQLQYCSGKI